MATARKALMVTAVGVGVVAVAFALWKIRVVIALFFVAVTIAAAMRPGVEALQARRIPRSAGVLLHYFVLLGVVALLLWLIVPQAIGQVEQALGGTGTHTQLQQAAAHTSGLEHQFLVGLDRAPASPPERCRADPPGRHDYQDRPRGPRRRPLYLRRRRILDLRARAGRRHSCSRSSRGPSERSSAIPGI